MKVTGRGSRVEEECRIPIREFRDERAIHARVPAGRAHGGASATSGGGRGASNTGTLGFVIESPGYQLNVLT